MENIKKSCCMDAVTKTIIKGIKMGELILKEDALNCFHDWIDRYGYEHTADEDPTYQLIEALDAVRYCDEDCISRRAAKEKLKRNLTYMRAFGVERCINLIDEIPAVETEPKWISCEEKMPEEDLWTGASQQYSYGVLMYVLDRSDGDTIIDFGHTIDGKWYSDTADTYVEKYSCKVIAWMLPPSYKENE